MDVDSITPGLDFNEAIGNAVRSCNILVALIGTEWLGAIDERGRRRISDPNDFVAREIKIALEQSIPVIPVLTDNAKLPDKSMLPDDLGHLAGRHAVRLNHATFGIDAKVLIDAIDTLLIGGKSQLVQPVRLQPGDAIVAPDRVLDSRLHSDQETTTALTTQPNQLATTPNPVDSRIAAGPDWSNSDPDVPLQVRSASPMQAARSKTIQPMPSPLSPAARDRARTLVSISQYKSEQTAPKVHRHRRLLTFENMIALAAVGLVVAIVASVLSANNLKDQSNSQANLPADPEIHVGSKPTGIAITPDSRRAYVANSGSASVSVIDIASSATIATISIPGSTPNGVAIASNGRTAYVTDYTGGSVAVIGTIANAVIDTIDVGRGAFGVAVTPDGRRIYVASQGTSTVSVIDASSDKVLKTILIPGNSPEELAMAPDGCHVYVTSGSSEHRASVIDTERDTVTANLTVGDVPQGIAFTPDGKRAYIAQAGAYTTDATVVDTGTGRTIATVPLGTPSFNVAISPNGARAYFTVSGMNSLVVADTATNRVLTYLPMPIGIPDDVAVAPDGRILVTNRGADSVSSFSSA